MKKQEWAGKINRARYVERNICSWIKRNFDPNAEVVETFSPERDIVSKALGDVEIKEDRMAHVTDNFAIEFVDGHGKPSGINVTQAKLFVIVDYENVYYIATEALKYVLRELQPLKTIEMGYKFDDGERSKGYLVPRHKLVNCPYMNTVPRWFPVLQEANVRK